MAYWNTSDKSASITLSVGDTVATRDASAGGYEGVRSVTSHATDTSGWYAEFLIDGDPVLADVIVGIANSSFNLANAPGNDATNVGYHLSGGVFYDSGSYTAGAYTPSDVVMLAFKNGSLWLGVNGTWYSGGDPAAGTGAILTGLSMGSVYLLFSGSTENDQATVRTAAADFGYSVPSTFSAWDSAAASSIAWVKA